MIPYYIKTISFPAAAFALLGTFGAAQAATFNSQTDFETAAGATTVETFDAEIATDVSITFANGTTSTKSSPGVPQTLNRVRNGVFTGFVQRDGFRDITFDFGADVFSFGGDFNSGLSNTSLMATGLFNGVSSTVSIADTIGQNGFFGLTSDTAFRQVTFRTNAGAFLFGGATPFGGETFSIDNLALGTGVPGPSVVPLPAAGLALMAGLGALGALRRRRRVQA